MATIGVYGFDAGSFLRRLRHTDVRRLLDERQRRGVRKPGYASWASSPREDCPDLAVVVVRARSNRYLDLLPLMEDVGAALRGTRAGEATVVGEFGRERGGGEAR